MGEERNGISRQEMNDFWDEQIKGRLPAGPLKRALEGGALNSAVAIREHYDIQRQQMVAAMGVPVRSDPELRPNEVRLERTLGREPKAGENFVKAGDRFRTTGAGMNRAGIVLVARSQKPNGDWHCEGPCPDGARCFAHSLHSPRLYLPVEALAAPADPLAGVDWTAFLPKAPLPRRAGCQDMRVGDVWAGRMERQVLTGGFVLLITELQRDGQWAMADQLAGEKIRPGGFATDSYLAQHGRLIARGGMLVGASLQDVERSGLLEPPAAKPVPVKRCRDAEICKAPAGTPLGYMGLCWPCADAQERLLGSRPSAVSATPIAKLRPEPYRNMNTAGIGVAGTIWRLR